MEIDKIKNALTSVNISIDEDCAIPLEDLDTIEKVLEFVIDKEIRIVEGWK